MAENIQCNLLIKRKDVRIEVMQISTYNLKINNLDVRIKFRAFIRTTSI